MNKHRLLSDMPPLSDFQLDIINGSLLGDGYCSKFHGNTNSRFKNEQALYRIEYVNWLYESLLPYSKSLDLNIRKDDRFKNKKSENCFLRTCNHPIFTELRKKWYIESSPKAIKCVPKDLKLNIRMVAIWFADDGCSQPENRHAFFCTESFHEPDLEYLVKELKKISINSSIDNSGRLYIGANFYKDFIEKISPFIVWKCFNYKINLDNYQESAKNLSGINTYGSKLNIDQVKSIISLYPSKNIHELSEMFNISQSQISRIIRGERWGGKRTIINLNNKSGQTGVGLLNNGFWYSRIQINNKIHYLGNFKNKDDAVAARKEAEIRFKENNNV